MSIKDEDIRKRPKSESDGFGYPKIDMGIEEAIERPIPVVFTQKTFIKLISWVLGPVITILIGAISAFFYFYHQTNSHMDNKNIHPNRLEIETKLEARSQRRELRKDIAEHVDIKVREIKVEQKEQIDRAKIELKRQQNYHYNKLINEIKETK